MGKLLLVVYLVDFLFAKLKKIILLNLLLPQVSTFSLGQKGCAYYGNSAYYECSYCDGNQIEIER